MKNRRYLSIILIAALFLQVISYLGPLRFVSAADEQRDVYLVGDLQDELGNTKDWDEKAAKTKMNYVENGFYEFKGTLPAGSYEYKVAINGSWDENYGKGGENIKITLDKETELTFYYNDETHKVTDSTSYTSIPKEQQPRLVGSIQPAILAGGEWIPEESTAFLIDSDFDNVYIYKVKVPKGKYEYKVILGKEWGANAYPEVNAVLNILEDTEITFSFNNDTKSVSTDYNPGGTDGLVVKDRLYHNTWETAYRQPFGAVPTGKEVKLRLSAKKGDLTRASLYVKNNLTGSTKLIPMTNAGWMDTKEHGQVDFWEATFTPDQKGVHGYKFIVGDEASVAEYGEDSAEGGAGNVVEQNASLFQLTVYDPDYKTPHWMKEAVVYQIFPDRFFNGNPNNDHAKDAVGARGDEPIEHAESWSDLPDNPRIKEKNLGEYTNDGIWSNDFFGGDIKGIQDKLDYIQSLGVNTLYLNPIAKATSNHKYDATDFKKIDPMFGSPKEFQAFVKELKKRDMHLILDGVFNHVADDSIYFDRYHKYKTVGAYEYWSAIYDLMNDKKMTQDDAKKIVKQKFIDEGQEFSPYGFENWFNIQNEKVKDAAGEHYKYQGWWGYDSLPEIKSVPGNVINHDSELNNEQFANYIFRESDSVAKLWLNGGSSGWRLDVANEVDEEFWRQFRKELKSKMVGAGDTLKAGEEPLILGEIWDDASKYFVGDQYDSVMNYRFRGAVLDLLKNGNATDTMNRLTAIQEDYPRESFYALMNLMGSHDTARAVFLLGNGSDTSARAEWDKNYNYNVGKQRLKLASILQMGYAGAPTIYYGDESGVTGSHDPDDRRTYNWGSEDKDLLNHYRKVGEVRTAHADLFGHGYLKHVYGKGDVFAYARTNNKKAAIVLINRGDKEQTVEIPVSEFANNGITFSDQLDSKYTATVANGVLKVKVGSMQGRMLLADLNVKSSNKVMKLKAEEGSKTVTLSWNGTAAKYYVYQSNINGALYEKVKETTDKKVVIDGLNNGRNYYFAVAAVDRNGNQSKLAATGEVIPHIDLTNAVSSIVTPIQDQTLNLSKLNVVEGALQATDAVTPEDGIVAKIEVKAPNSSNWESYKAMYDRQEGNKAVFKASFRAFVPGAYTYRVAFSSDNGRQWIQSADTSVTFSKDMSDTENPVEEVTLEQPKQESGQVNLHWRLIDKEDPYLITVIRDGEVVAVLDDTTKTTYRDYEVENGKTYQYQIRVYDAAGNHVDSATVSVTPDIVMVQVTFKVHAPAYTQLSEKITMPGNQNGWNTGAWEMSRNGAVTPDWEYKVELQEGTELVYKYVKGGSWDQEGLADHTPYDKTDDDISNYGYGASGTDMKVVVQNQGDNKMTVQDTILRWIDQPIVLETPQDNAVVQGDSVEFKGNAIKDGILKIGGQEVEIQPDMTFSHVVKLEPGKNEIPVSIEPSEQSKKDVFKGDAGAIGKNTKAFVVNVTRQ